MPEKLNTEVPALGVYLTSPMPEQQWILKITPDFYITGTERPSRWRRFWHWVFLGWRWEREN
jgi:hypothetical protein